MKQPLFPSGQRREMDMAVNQSLLSNRRRHRTPLL
jgi:hypothetical protein